jgi:hypothetical protein
MISETNTVTGETRKRLPYAELGRIMLEKHGEAMCYTGYKTVDPAEVGRLALDVYKDINPDGTTN